MGILDQLSQKKSQLVIIHEWLESRPKKEREEWLEAMRRPDIYPTAAIFRLLKEHGLNDVNENGVVRYRRKLEGYVSQR